LGKTIKFPKPLNIIMPKPRKPLKPSEKYAKDAAESVRGSKKYGNMPREDLRRSVMRHRQVRNRLREKEK
jgi:hypothetical protein